MDILDIIASAKNETLAFENHPACKLDLEQRQLYLNGIAVAMSVDGEIHPREKEYLAMLINSFNLPPDSLEQFVAFAKNPEKEVFQSIIKTFSSSDIRVTFLIDALMVIHRDQMIHEREDRLFAHYAEMMKVSNAYEYSLKNIVKSIIDNDKMESRNHLAADYFTIVQKYSSYLIKYLNIEIKSKDKPRPDNNNMDWSASNRVDEI